MQRRAEEIMEALLHLDAEGQGSIAERPLDAAPGDAAAGAAAEGAAAAGAGSGDR